MPITGNTGKIKVIEKIKELSSNKNNLKILDIGCGNLNLWVDSGIKLDYIEIHCIDRSKKALQEAEKNAENLSKDSFHFYESTISDFPSLFDFKFDLVVSTNVLEHLKNISEFFNNIHKIMKNDAMGLFVCDSAYYNPKETYTKKGMNFAYKIKRQYIDDFYLHPLKMEEIKNSLLKSNMELLSLEYYCMDNLKYIHNHLLKINQKDEFAQKWIDLEKFLNENEQLKNDLRQYCTSIYFEAKVI